MQELTTFQFINLLRERNIDVRAKEGRLQINAPAGAVDSQMREELTRRKGDLLSALQSAAAIHIESEIAPGERTGKIPQTDAQQGLWLIDFFDPGCVAYNIPVAYSAEGPFDADALQTAVDQILVRHETLRTSFYEEDGELFQRVANHVTARVELTDISHVSEADRDQVLERLIREQARRPFDLNQAPLVRFHLFRLAEQQHAVFFNIHHIIADRRSLAILREELSALYQAAVRNETAALPNLPVQYPDYALWAAMHLADGQMQKQAMYWKTKLAALPEYLELSNDRPYPEKRTPWGETTSVAIDASLRDCLKRIAQQEGATMFMTLLAAFAVLLYKKCGQEDFCIGSPSTLRTQVETESIIGLFVNMIVFRCDLSGDPSFRNVVQRVRITALEAYENSDLPFQELARTLKVDLRSMRSPFFQVMFGFDSEDGEQPSSLIQLDTKPGTARFDLTLQLTEGANGISGSFEYCTDLFDEPGMTALSRRFVALLGEVAANPDRSVSAFEMSTVENPAASASRQRPVSPGLFRRAIRPLSQWYSRQTRAN
jgi:condensation domain-containing protein/tubulysin polyketide synthase-like protein